VRARERYFDLCFKELRVTVAMRQFLNSPHEGTRKQAFNAIDSAESEVTLAIAEKNSLARYFYK
jgi:hypothetical protein